MCKDEDFILLAKYKTRTRTFLQLYNSNKRVNYLSD